MNSKIIMYLALLVIAGASTFLNAWVFALTQGSQSAMFAAVGAFMCFAALVALRREWMTEKAKRG